MRITIEASPPKARRGRPRRSLSQIRKLCSATLAANRTHDPLIVWALSAKAEGIVELIVGGFYVLAEARCPAPQPLGRTDEPHTLSMKPSSVVVLALEV